MTLSLMVFVVAAAALLVSAIAVISARNPLMSALALISSLVFLAVLFVILDAAFVAAMQVLVYAGAILVLFVFVIMLLNLQQADDRPFWVAMWDRISISKILGAGAAIYLGLRVGLGALQFPGGAGVPVDGSVKVIGALMMSQYVFAFEAIGVLLLVAIVGPVVLGMKRLQ
ncbi:MAG: NADH-quinone oxidoreductase subunit J [Clostridia bacterium]|nr:NADH-quinone oxidoreductase subunit J [Deltaproteobacteria bacterium]